jgi:hypothetical protein
MGAAILEIVVVGLDLKWELIVEEKAKCRKCDVEKCSDEVEYSQKLKCKSWVLSCLKSPRLK